jgi:hypothetical protein
VLAELTEVLARSINQSRVAISPLAVYRDAELARHVSTAITNQPARANRAS